VTRKAAEWPPCELCVVPADPTPDKKILYLFVLMGKFQNRHGSINEPMTFTAFFGIFTTVNFALLANKTELAEQITGFIDEVK
jgi:hypothetical protein